jgi:serine-rich protein C30B4.01c, putative
MSINSSYLNPDSSGDPYGSSSSNGSADSYGTDTYGAGTETGTYGAGAANASNSYSFSGGYSSYDEPASPLSTTSAASATGASETGAGTTAASASATSASSAAYNSTGAYSSTEAYSTSSSNSTKEDAVWRGQDSKEPAELKRPRVSTLVASLIMLAAAAILGALAMGVHFSWTAVGASTLGTIGLVLIVSAFFANRNKSHT